MPNGKTNRKQRLTVYELTLFALLGCLMFTSKFLMAAIPNVKLIALSIAAITIVFRVRALFPIYVYVALEGVVYGFTPWWIPYLYIWLPLWGAVMLVSKFMPDDIYQKKNTKKIVFFTVAYMVVCAAHGYLFGTMWAPAQAIMFHLNFKGTIAWIIAGLPFDMIHGTANFFICSLVIPLAALIKRAGKTNFTR